MVGVSVLAGALLLAACGSSGFHYVKSSEDRTFFKVPEEWKLYDNDTLLDAASSDLSDEELEQVRQTQWAAVFDGHPTPALAHIANKAPKHPVGRALVQDLTPESADGVSLMSLRNLFYDVDAKLEKQTAEVISYEPVERDGGFHGSHLVVRLATQRGDVVVNQIALLDQGTTKVYALAVACSVKCYDDNKSKIEQILDSWTVEES
jgi:hypothetical protein